MSDTQENALIKVSDLFGVSKPAIRLIEAIERGVGNLLQPWHTQRIASAEISNFERWQSALEKSGLSARSADLTLQDRAAVRLLAQEIQRQGNRESIALESAKEFKETIEGIGGDTPDPLDVEWVDRFWRLAQDITDADMQAVWGRILARQTTGRGKYSARCLETISLLSREEISHLERIAKFLWSATREGQPSYFILCRAKPDSNEQLPAELSASINDIVGELHREIFGPAGIFLDSGSGWAQSIIVDVIRREANFRITSIPFTLTFPNDIDEARYIGSGLGVSPLGAEVFSLINATPDPVYIAAITAAFKFFNVELKIA